MITIKINYNPYYQQQLFHESLARFRVVCAGRRFGKSLMACAEAFKLATNQPKQRGWIITPTFKLSEEDWRILKEISPNIAIQEIKLADKKLVYRNGSEIEMKSADNEASLRGAGLDFLIIDEASRIKEDSWHAVRPALSDKQGRAIFISTPKGKNWFYTEYLKGQEPDNKDYESWRFSSKVNPYFSINEYNDLKANLPADVFSQEIEAEFIDNASQVFRNIKDQISGSLEDPKTNEVYFMGVDLAKHHDFTCIIVLNSSKHLVFFDRFQKLDWDIQKAKILNIAKKYNNASIRVDSTGIGDPIEEDLRKANGNLNQINPDYIHVEGFKFTNISKNQLISNLQLAFETGAITFPNIPVLNEELEAFEYEILPSGNFRYSAPSGLNDDTVIALALSNWGSTHPGPQYATAKEIPGLNMRPGESECAYGSPGRGWEIWNR